MNRRLNRWCYTKFSFFLVSIFVLLLPAISLAQDEGAPGEGLLSRLTETRDKLEDIGKVLRTLEESKDQEAIAQTRRSLRLYEEIEFSLSSQLEELQRREEFNKELMQAQAELEQTDLTAPGGAPIQSFRGLEALRRELATGLSRLETLEAELDAEKRTREEAEQLRDARGRTKRELQEELGGKESRDRTQGFKLSLAKLQLEAAEAALKLQQEKIRTKQLELRLQRQRNDLKRRKIRWYESRISFSKEDLAAELEQLDARRDELLERSDSLKERYREAERKLAASKRKLDSSELDRALQEQIEADLAERAAISLKQRSIREQLDFIGLKRELWETRFRLLNGSLTDTELTELRDTLEDSLSELSAQLALESRRLTEQRQKLLAVETELEADTLSRTIIRELKRQRQALGETLSSYDEWTEQLISAQQLVTALLGEVDSRINRFELGSVFRSASETALGVWNYELTTVDDRPISPGKIVYALFFLVLGYFASKWLTKRLGRRLQTFGVAQGASAAVESLSFYLLMLLFMLLSLQAVNVPLTAFTVIGGAVAIGVGFGSQNIVNNFISGIIMLIEQPIRVGDLIEVGTLTGRVQHIGARSTRVRTPTNIDIIVPNSAFLEQNVINWTHSDRQVRMHVRVGVAYGSPTRRVEELLLEIVNARDRVLKFPKPFVWFHDFGDSALLFDLHFWMSVRTLAESFTEQSEIRHQIDDAFKKAGITIAFPQRDVHLDSLAPIQVKMVEGSN